MLKFKKYFHKKHFNKRLKSLRTAVIQNTVEFCKNSTLHGLRYLVNKDLNPIERAFFAISFVSVVFMAGFFINNVYKKWNTTPVIFCINPQPTFITNEPFPALTICNMNQACRSKVAKYDENSAEYAIIQMLCKRQVNNTVAHGINDWSILNSFITNISQPCEKMLLSCRFGSISYNCRRLFHPIVTDEGLCCGFNMVHPRFMYQTGTVSLIDEISTNHSEVDSAVPWTPEKGYPKNLPKAFYPYKAAGTGETLGLTVILDVQADEYYCSSSNSKGFKIAMHSPTETPNIREVGLPLAAGYETKARLRIEKLESDYMLHKVHRKHRQCLFQDEHNLKYFASYSQHNCETECMARMLMQHCGCVTHFMPKRFNNTTVCSIYDVSCVERVRLQHLRNANGEMCLPSCFDLKHYAEFFTTPLSNTGFEIASKVLQNLSSKYIENNIAIVTMYYKDNLYHSKKQTEFIGMTDVLSSVGGLIGLFFGFSFISLAEIIFFAFFKHCRRPTAKQKVKSSTRKRYSLRSRKIRSYPSNSLIFHTTPKVKSISDSLDINQYYMGNRLMPYSCHTLTSSLKPRESLKREPPYDYIAHRN